MHLTNLVQLVSLGKMNNESSSFHGSIVPVLESHTVIEIVVATTEQKNDKLQVSN